MMFARLPSFVFEFLHVFDRETVKRIVLLGQELTGLYRGFRIDGPASSWPKGHEKTKSSWPSKNGFGHNSAGLSPILIRI